MFSSFGSDYFFCTLDARRGWKTTWEGGFLSESLQNEACLSAHLNTIIRPFHSGF